MINMKDLIKKQGDMIRRQSGMNITEAVKDPEHIFKHVIRAGTQITYPMKVVYMVTKLYPGGFLMRIYKNGNNPGMFAPKARIEKDNFISQVKVGLIKKVK